MIQTLNGNKRSAFSWWLRTGRLPRIQNPDGLEVKFNPWHDPQDGRFTFAGSGQYFGAGGAGSAGRAGEHAPRIVDRDGSAKPRIVTKPNVEASRAEQLGNGGKKPEDRGAIEARSEGHAPTLESRLSNQPNLQPSLSAVSAKDCTM